MNERMWWEIDRQPAVQNALQELARQVLGAPFAASDLGKLTIERGPDGLYRITHMEIRPRAQPAASEPPA